MTVKDTGVYPSPIKQYDPEKMLADFHRRWNALNPEPASEEQATAYVTQYIGSLEREGYTERPQADITSPPRPATGDGERRFANDSLCPLYTQSRLEAIVSAAVQEAAEGEGVQAIGDALGCPPGIRVVKYAALVRKWLERALQERDWIRDHLEKIFSRRIGSFAEPVTVWCFNEGHGLVREYQDFDALVSSEMMKEKA